MAKKPLKGTKGATIGLTLKAALAIKANNYRSVKKVAGGRDFEQDYDKGEIDQFIIDAQERQAERELKNLEKSQREVSLEDLPLFQNKEVFGIIQSHIKEIGKLEELEAKKIISEYSKIRGIMRDRLDILGKDTFTAQKLRGALIQVDSALIEMQSLLKDSMVEAGEKASLKGVSHLFEEISKFNEKFTGAIIPIDVDAVLIASEINNLLMTKYEASLRAYTEDIRAAISGALTTAVIEKASYSDVIRRLSVYFKNEEWKLHRIVRTELHQVYNMSKQRGLFDIKDQYVEDIQKTLIHPMDSRTGEDSKQAAAKNLIVDIEQPFRYTYVRYLKNGTKVTEERVFMAPPDRPNDRSILVPYRESWEE